jgi:fatty acid desaturase
VRRTLHLLHHETSGTERDLEERGITNGVPWSLKRLLMLVDPLASVVGNAPHDPRVRRYILRKAARAYLPLGWLALAIWYAFLVLSAVALATGATPSGYRVVTALTVVWIGPNVLRVACLHFVSSNMHYYGDVEEGNVIEQTQVLNRWFLAPLQLFCCNFGSTHGIHHFVPGDPFYIRQLTARAAHPVMRANGVRFNDLGTFRRSNRLEPLEA